MARKTTFQKEMIDQAATDELTIGCKGNGKQPDSENRQKVTYHDLTLSVRNGKADKKVASKRLISPFFSHWLRHEGEAYSLFINAQPWPFWRVKTAALRIPSRGDFQGPIGQQMRLQGLKKKW
jgi:hypothetical protein